MKGKFIAACLAVVCSVGLVAAGATLVSPASAKTSINWGRIWKTQLQPHADARYYTKAQARKLFAPYPKVIRGTFDATGDTTSTNEYVTSSISFGVTLAAPPTIHYIPVGGLVPTGCSGSVTAPNAAPGNLCIFQSNATNTNATPDASGTYDPATDAGTFASSNTMGITVYARSATIGQVFSFGTWALHPRALATGRTMTPAPRATGPAAVR